MHAEARIVFQKLLNLERKRRVRMCNLQSAKDCASVKRHWRQYMPELWLISVSNRSPGQGECTNHKRWSYVTHCSHFVRLRNHAFKIDSRVVVPEQAFRQILIGKLHESEGGVEGASTLWSPDARKRSARVALVLADAKGTVYVFE
ncbi:hypothetical protein JB92DRAFT_2829143 [Gautieria morchelliformis]|nr:hypothetical protein JB92DRAFT_2829143 [Gautieria morchelliformis]